MATPNWLGASVANRALAGQINQFLGTHTSTLLYTGALLEGQTTAGAGSTNTNSLYLAQSFTPGSNQTPGRVVLSMSVTGTPNPLSLSIQTTTSGHPSGTALVTTLLPPGFLTGSLTNISVPLPCSLTSGVQYWIVANAVGDVSNLYTWGKSNQVSGASTSPTTATWTAQSYGFVFSVYDQTTVTPLVHTYEDSGVRWTWSTYNAGDLITALKEYTIAQAANDYVQSSRSFSYTSNLLTSVT